MVKIEIIESAKQFVEKFIKDTIEPKGFLFHNWNHTLSVYDRVCYLADKEGISLRDKEKLMIAALFHDTGFYKTYQGHEEESVNVFKKWLKEENINVDEEFIEDVSRLILSTNVMVNPKKLDEKIIKDADLDNLGTDEFFYYFKVLFEEIKNVVNPDMKLCEFVSRTYDLFKDFSFYTDTMKVERLAKWKENLNILSKLYENCNNESYSTVEKFFKYRGGVYKKRCW